MTQTKAIIIFLLFAFTHAGYSVPIMPANDLSTIKQNFFRMLIPSQEDKFGLKLILSSIPPEKEMADQAVIELHQRYPSDKSIIRNYISNQLPDGSWRDINYLDKKRSGWEPKKHAERILELIKVFQTKGAEYYHSKEAENTIHKALYYWFDKKPVCSNWWYNQIGVPKTLGTAFILFEPYLTPEEKEKAIRVMNNSKFGMTGQNKVWLAGNVMIRALLENDYNLVKEARDVIVSEITIGKDEGIQTDWSFHQHGPQQQFGNYGLSFVTGMSFFSGLLANTSLAFEKKQLNIINELINNGYRWILWKGYMDINALGRQLFHHVPLHKALSLTFASTELDGGHNPQALKVAQAVYSDNYDKPAQNTLTGHKHFWKSDYTIHRAQNWMASLKMASTRVRGVESMNGDNMKGFYMADGAMYIYKKGDEYLDIFPLWDWRKLPGITALQDQTPVPLLKSGYNPGNDSSFAGGVSDGKTGISAMKLNRAGIHALKSWIFTDDFILCLGAGISSDSSLAVHTTIEQCFLRGKVSGLENGKWIELSGNVSLTGKEYRLFHNQTGYISLNNHSLISQIEERKGRWCDIMKMYHPAQISGNIFQLFISHGINPESASYQYLILPYTDKEKLKNFDLSQIKILRNDETAQIVYHTQSKQYWITAYRPVSLTLDSKNHIDINTYGGYMISIKGNSRQIWGADFSCSHDSANIILNGKQITFAFSKEKGKSTCIKL